MKPHTLAIDLGLGVALLIALIAVYLVDCSSVSKPSNPDNTLKVNILYGEAGKDYARQTTRSRLRLAVTRPRYDDIGRLLDSLGSGYSYDTLDDDELSNSARLKNFDVLFLTCSEEKPKVRKVFESLSEFVAQGGTLYSSDLRFDILINTFPSVIERTLFAQGNLTPPQSVKATVVDPGLRDFLKASTVDLDFDQPGWRPAMFRQDQITTYLEGKFTAAAGQVNMPLTVSFRHGRGTVIFTSFHNAKNEGVGVKLLQYLVFTAVTAQVDSQMTEQLEEGGFTPKQSSLITMANDTPSVTKTYTIKKSGKARFQLSFNPGDVRLRLTIQSPDGKSASAEHSSSFSIEVPEASAGEWKYTVTAIKVPYANFPFRVTVGEEK
jgi:hypothetical protein